MGKLIDSDKVLSLIKQEQASCDIIRWYDFRCYRSLENVRREVEKMQKECEKEAEYALRILDEIRNRDGIGYNDYSDLWDAISALKGLHAADVVPMVRCKECKFRDNDDFCTGRGFPYQLVPDDGFCDKGEREE